jgi:hypothetical protein
MGTLRQRLRQIVGGRLARNGGPSADFCWRAIARRSAWLALRYT